MTWWQWCLLVYAIGVPISFCLNMWMLVESGGYVTSVLAIIRNALLWPIMLPIIFGMWLQSRG